MAANNIYLEDMGNKCFITHIVSCHFACQKIKKALFSNLISSNTVITLCLGCHSIFPKYQTL